jgi:hypothetical protein
LVQFLLCLAGTGVGTATTILGIAGLVVASSTAAFAALVGRPLSRDVSVNAIGGGSGDIAAASTTRSTATAARSVSFVVTGRTQAASIACGALHAVEKRTASTITATVAATITASTAGDERQTDGLALGVGAVVLLNRGVCVLQMGVCDVSDSLGASSAVVSKG